MSTRYDRPLPRCALLMTATLIAFPAAADGAPGPRTYSGPTSVADERPASSDPAREAGSTGSAAVDHGDDDDGDDFASASTVRARNLTRAGIGMTIVGGVLGLGAVFLWALDPCDPEPGNDCRERTRRNAALTIGIPAAAITVAGVTSLGIGVARSRRISASLRVGTGHASIAVGGRF